MRQGISHNEPFRRAEPTETVEGGPGGRRHGHAVDIGDVTRFQRLLTYGQARAFTDPLSLGATHMDIEVVQSAYVDTEHPRGRQAAEHSRRREQQSRRSESQFTG